ncbi:putative secondary metabolism biosynthetic enzyme [Trichoderma atroviride]|uniref:putative secondary metabolism biosynthetic enzyme n=1 Tax=Hypocrea atroviridis TaxID=63577 RepID=UPI0033265121|nr:putative secondary metabolism biosynthetic enzyme [Trichoderma atroviride]
MSNSTGAEAASNPDRFVYHQLFTPNFYHDVYPSIEPENPQLKQDGRIILITGASGPIASEHARFFAKAGAKEIILSARRLDVLESLKKEIANINSAVEIDCIQGDLTSEEDVNSLWNDSIEKFGTINVVISCAASRSQMKKIGDTDIQGWWSDFETNVKALYLLARHTANLKSESPATFINVTSSMAIETIPTRSNYAITKSAGCRLIEYLHTEHPNVRAFNLHPGIVPNGVQFTMLSGANVDTAALSAGVSLYLTTPQAEFLRGRFISANWAIDDLEAKKDEIVKQNLLTTYIRAKFGPGGHFAQQ